MHSYVCVGGLNLYHRTLKKTSHKWLDLRALLGKLLSNSHQILAIRYYIAVVNGRGDPRRPIRQKTYLRAVQASCPNIFVNYGQSLTHMIKARLAKPIGGIRYAHITKTDEKDSDVNLAVHLLNDSWLDGYDCAFVVSNDSDLCEALHIVRQEHNRHVGIGIPWNSYLSKSLLRYTHFSKHIRQGLLASCQLPKQIPVTNITKPQGW